MDGDLLLKAASLAVGLAGFLFGLVKYRAEKIASKEARELQERSQAEQVSAWAGKREGEERWVYVRNASGQIVHDVKAWLVTPLSPAPPDGELPDHPVTTQRAVLEPGETLEHRLTSLGGSGLANRPPVLVAFADVERRSWIRTAGGKLLRRKT